MLSTPIGLNSLGAEFVVEAPWCACRLCGAIYQSSLDRKCYAYGKEGRLTRVDDPLTGERYYIGDPQATRTLDEATDRRKRWRELHEKRNHTESETAQLHKTGFAMTPEAANKLAPFGITPLGNMHDEIVDALFTAPRAPIDDAES